MRQPARLAVLMLFAGFIASCALLKPREAAETAGIPEMGLYSGAFVGADRNPVEAAAEVIGLGDGEYRIDLTRSADAAGEIEEMTLQATTPGWFGSLFKGKITRIGGEAEGAEWTGTIGGGRLTTWQQQDEKTRYQLSRIQPESPTAGAPSPEGAIVLLPYTPGEETTLEAWTNQDWEILADGSIQVRNGENRSKREFRDVQLHVEFRTPYQPEKRGQGRGNSGVYLQNYYEVQVLDSFGLEPKNNECGGLYSIAAPEVNVCFPPESWQTYDIVFRAARFDDDGNRTEPARITVLHNGVKIHENQPLPRGTEKSKPGGEPRVGPIKLQDHGNPVRYRNIWVVELGE